MCPFNLTQRVLFYFLFFNSKTIDGVGFNWVKLKRHVIILKWFKGFRRKTLAFFIILFNPFRCQTKERYYNSL